ncbi:DUF1289 domain-containing protein [Rheinheimera sp. MMS21-TC3]|uniref:DUF1289 domain-containing protein n=1 Tax=Rheinheimera sp. MMS21-TC3 TaxID=3072790 RepID=UPI0028C3D0B1|nr:DUF1289 domain-containing protein [Rheinheimera sp. MMS21-TC3]WNO60171.1 DUF1289 domain-containing protein [Rheinheimera sp. MMS21-TC3]
MLKSPCVRNCCLDQQDCCLGCGRILSEITGWAAASDQQQQILVLAKMRKQQREARLNLSVSRQAFFNNTD